MLFIPRVIPVSVCVGPARHRLVLQERESRSYLSSLAPRRLSSTSDAEEKENR